jgi:hypothetical protein
MTNQIFDQNDTSELKEDSGGQLRRHSRNRRTHASGWAGGAILIGIGLILLFQNLGGSSLENWWALFILIPAAGAFGRAWSAYQSSGARITAQVRSSFFSGLVLTMVAAIFLLNLNWIILGPVLLILAGAGLLINAMLPG